jgi:hypothetical protein
MAYDYTAYPTSANLTAWMTAMVPSVTRPTNSDVLGLLLLSASKAIEKQTGRQFVTVTEDRYFDGSGSGILMVDDFVSITSDSQGKMVYIYAAPGNAYGQSQLTGIQEVYEPGKPSNMIQIFQGPANSAYMYINYFPVGRSNVKINATWGYASTVPADVFELIMAKAASSVIAGSAITDGGIVISDKLADEGTTYANDRNWFETSGWGKRWKEAVRSYRRDMTTVLARRQLPPY